MARTVTSHRQEPTIVASARLPITALATFVLGMERMQKGTPLSLSGASADVLRFAERVLIDSGMSEEFDLEAAVDFLTERNLMQRRNSHVKRTLQQIDHAIDNPQAVAAGFSAVGRSSGFPQGSRQETGDAFVPAYKKPGWEMVKEIGNWMLEVEDAAMGEGGGQYWPWVGEERLRMIESFIAYMQINPTGWKDDITRLADETWEGIIAERNKPAPEVSGIAGIPTFVGDNGAGDTSITLASAHRGTFNFGRLKFKIPYGILIDWVEEKNKVERREDEPIGHFMTRQDEAAKEAARIAFLRRIEEDPNTFNEFLIHT